MPHLASQLYTGKCHLSPPFWTCKSQRWSPHPHYPAPDPSPLVEYIETWTRCSVTVDASSSTPPWRSHISQRILMYHSRWQSQSDSQDRRVAPVSVLIDAANGYWRRPDVRTRHERVSTKWSGISVRNVTIPLANPNFRRVTRSTSGRTLTTGKGPIL